MKDWLFRNLNVGIFFLLLTGSLGAAVLEQVNTTAVQTLTNKTLTSPTISSPTIANPTFSGTMTGTITTGPTLLSPTITVGDAAFSIFDTGTTTRNGVFQLSGLTNPSTRTWTMPDANTTLVGHDFAQTLTNKTITAPVFSGTATGTYTLGGTPTISSPAISAPVFSGTATGTYTLGGTPSVTAPILTGTTTGTGLLDLSGASAGQVKFPASQNASANVNTLDDYEEGSWTPSLGGNTTYTQRTGTYTKIGRMVHLQGDMTVNVLGTGSVNQVSGLPYTVASGGVAYTGAVSVTSMATSVVSIMCQIQTGGSVVIFPAFTASGTSTATPSVFQNGTAVAFSVTYTAAN